SVPGFFRRPAGAACPALRPDAMKESRSAWLIRPPGPVPGTNCSSTPASQARRRTAGEAIGFSPGVLVANPGFAAPCGAGFRPAGEGAGFAGTLAAFEGAGLANSGADLGCDGTACCGCAPMFPGPST